MNICVFLSAADLDERYVEPTREFAEQLGSSGHTLVWGGSDVGLMKVLADGVQAAGGRLCGVSVEFLTHVVRPGCDEMVITKDLGERKALLLDKADAVIMLVGGTGTLDETTDILELRKHELSDKPLAVVNTAGFYDGLKIQLERMDAEGFLPIPLPRLMYFADTGKEALDYVEKYAEKHAVEQAPTAG
ncbi:TIGR00730 family Rossman fold protein [Streptomyces sp. NBC_01478]|uniref:LOG family protein n=1 Tax=Streptomyces sp. NBC_01478 TaxID=2903882 RepID=UPI002E3660DA|nr:TIGR00730 family Rossman fold protein [Streptomyces sp. NBC_01478]